MPEEQVLLVDDDPLVLRGLQRMLGKRFDPQAALGAEAGLRQIREHGPFAVVVSDQAMPGMSGVEFLHQVSVEAPDTVRILLTGDATSPKIAEAVNNGRLFCVLNKPASRDELQRTIEGGIERHRELIARHEASG